MKKLRGLALVLILVCAFTLASCVEEFVGINPNAPSEEQTSKYSTEQPTEQPSEQPTEQPTEESTEQPSEQPTEKPTEKPTEQPTENPSESGEIKLEGLDTENLDFEGEELGVLIRQSTTVSRELGKESPEDDLDDAIVTRNKFVQETLNVKFKPIYFDDNISWDDLKNNFSQVIQQDVDNGRANIDIVANYAYLAVSANIRDYLCNLNDKELFPNFNFSLPCWNQAMVNNTTVNGKLYAIAGDMNLSMFDKTMVIWYNKTLYDAKKTANDSENIQEHAIEGKWTYDDLYSWANRLYEDSGIIAGAKDANDTYGFAMNQNRDTYDWCAINQVNPHDALPAAWDLELMTIDNDGTHSYNIIGNTKAEQALIKFRQLMNANGSWAQSTENLVKSFATGNYVFMCGTIYPNEEDNLTIRTMEDKYGLLPIPKYDKDQENYGTTTMDDYNLMTVLNHEDVSGGAISAFLELSNEESYNQVRKYYFNRIIKPKYFGTDDSEGTVANSLKLFDIIAENIEYDFVTVYSYPLNSFMVNVWRRAAGTSAGETLESNFRVEQKMYEEALLELDNWFFDRKE